MIAYPYKILEWYYGYDGHGSTRMLLDESGEVTDTYSSAGVYSDKAGMMIGRQYHYGIKVGDVVFDNMTLGGLNFNKWLEDLGIGVVGGIDWEIVNEITNKWRN